MAFAGAPWTSVSPVPSRMDVRRASLDAGFSDRPGRAASPGGRQAWEVRPAGALAFVAHGGGRLAVAGVLASLIVIALGVAGAPLPAPRAMIPSLPSP